MKKSVKWFSLLIVAGLVVSFAACQKKAPAVSGSSGAPAAGIRDVINVGINADPGDLSPWSPVSTGRSDTEEMLYQALAVSVAGESQGVLFKEFKLSPDEKYVDIFLYDYIHDSAGNPIKASDVVYSYTKAKASGNVRSASVCDRAEELDEYTVRLYFNKTLYVGELDMLLTQIYIVSKTAYESSSDGMASSPVSTSPYKLTKYTSGYMLTFEKDANYWQKTDSLTPARYKANVKTINYYIITETSQMTMALENGSVDLSWHVGNDDIHLFDAGGAQSGKYAIYKAPDNLVTEVWLNNEKSTITGGSVDLGRAS
jgi:ABC-type transport system substrate-binding protein